MQYTGRPHGGEGRGPSDEDGLRASNIFERGSQLCHDSSRVSAMPTSRAYGTRYAIHPNMLTHDLHGPHAVIINMDLRVHGHVLHKRRHACSTTTNGCLGCYIKSTTWPQYKYGMPPRVHEHAGSGATHLSLVAHHPLSIDMLPHGLSPAEPPG